PEPPVTAVDGFDPVRVMEELKAVREMILELNEKVDERDKLKGIPRSLQAVYKTLVRNQVEEKLALRVVQGARQRLADGNGGDEEAERAACCQVIEGLLRKPRPIELTLGRPRVVAMVGPTGVGKTTTIAKLAANFHLLEKKQVGLITIDTYRIAAVEQLKTYAEIIGVVVEVVFHPQELREAIDRLHDCDIIFIDTAGRSPRNEPQISELAEFMGIAAPDEIILVLQANAYYEDLLDVYRRFSAVRIDKLVFTKLDESDRWGTILDVVHRTRTPLAYVTTGQNVPDDIEVPDTGYLARMMVGEGTPA
ncbi:MAG: flagellar biosynthesis protein FlhF, partial [Syntrophomonadaceae bacterium]|nr:flagellar biosynthesis protein FlhF [Syntrophomonadaceae bacterium]